MAKMRGMSNGGVFGTGIFGMFGTVVKCDSKDDSMYCNLAKFINLIFMFLFLAFIFYIIYYFFKTIKKTKGR